MNAIVVYESCGNTAEVARAVAEVSARTPGPCASTRPRPADVAGADLIVAGAPVFGFKLSSPQMRDGIRANPGKGPAPDLSRPPLCTWLEELAPGSGWGAAFDTQVRGPFGKGAPEIARLLEAAGYAPLAEPEGFVVKGRHGPLKKGEIERARAWGESLARAMRSGPAR